MLHIYVTVAAPPNQAGSTALYRAVGPAELDDIRATGASRNLGSAEGKYFCTSAEAASSFAKQAVKGFGDPAYTLIETLVPDGILGRLTQIIVDSSVPACFIPAHELPGLMLKVLDAMPIPL